MTSRNRKGKYRKHSRLMSRFPVNFNYTPGVRKHHPPLQPMSLTALMVLRDKHRAWS